jgi:acetyltransferase-like isoleucine patch superfamily enzyme
MKFKKFLNVVKNLIFELVILIPMRIVLFSDSVHFDYLRGRYISLFLRSGKDLKIGVNVRFYDYSGITLGDDVSISRNCEIHGPCELGDGAFININSYLGTQSFIGKNVAIGPDFDSLSSVFACFCSLTVWFFGCFSPEKFRLLWSFSR